MELVDLTGKRFGRLTVIERVENAESPNGTKRTMWKCKCDCGNECVRSYQNLTQAEEASCGCRKSELTSKRILDDLTGQRFGRLTVIERAPSGKGGARWKCICDCGKEIETYGSNLKSGHTKSCGCYRNESRVKVKTKHGYRNTRIYGVWSKMKDRCYKESNPSYPRYGGRGITMCDEWRDNAAAFIEWAYENGYKEDAKYGECTVDRIDNSKGYSPENCRIVNEKVQANNRRSNRWIEYNGEMKTLAQVRDMLGISQWKAWHYLVEKGMTVQEFLEKDSA